MDAQHTAQPDAGIGYGAWLAFWAQLIGLGLLTIGGAFFASHGGGPGDYDCGLILSLAALALLFLRLKHFLDGGSASGRSFLLVDDMPNLALVIPLFALIGLGGLFLAAASGEGSLHDAGIGLFGACGLIVFLSLKRVFDTLDRHR